MGVLYNRKAGRKKRPKEKKMKKRKYVYMIDYEDKCGSDQCECYDIRDLMIQLKYLKEDAEKNSRFLRLKETHPKLYDYCMNGGEYDQEDGMWKPNKQGLGMRHVFEALNKIYGDDFIKYE